MKIYFATHNPGKVAEFAHILADVCTLEQIELEYDEIQADDPSLVAAESAQRLANEHNKPIVVEDSGLFIDALSGFPGVYSAPIHKQIGLTGILKLLEGKSDRSCSYKSAVGYCAPGSEPVVFIGEERGNIAESEKGSFGFGHDPIFIPEGSEKTYAEMEDVKAKKQFRKKALLQLVEYLKKKD